MYLVTGGSGFCGWEMVKYLLKKGEKVRVLDIEELPEKLQNKNLEFIRGSILREEDLEKAFKGVDRVIHEAALVPISKAGDLFIKVNVDGTRKVLQKALEKKVKKVVYISSSSVQILNKSPIKEEDPYAPFGEYAVSKMRAELVCREFIKKGLDVSIIRPKTVIGGGRLGIFDILFDWISEGRKIYIIGNGKNKIQFIHVADLSSACYLASRKRGSNVFNVGAREFNSLRRDLELLIKHAKSRSKVVGIPIWLAVPPLWVLDKLGFSPLSSWHYRTYSKEFFFNNEKTIKVLGWHPKYSNEELLVEACDWFLKNKDKNLGSGSTHRKHLSQGALSLLKKVS